MVNRFKLAYIGAGSFRFSIGFFRNIVNAVELMPMEVALCDIDEKSLQIMSKILERMVKKASKLQAVQEKASKYHGYDIKITSSTDRKVVLENADFVYKSISVGLQKAEWFDNYLPIKFGIPQNTGDTVGPGGIFRNLRTNPVVAGIVKDMKNLCPKAPLLNYTNPQSGIVMAAKTTAPDIQYIGLCHELFGGMGTIAKWLREKKNVALNSWTDLNIEYGGVNHFAWLTKLEYQGKDWYPELRQDGPSLVKEKFGGRGFNFYLMTKYNYFPYPGSRHVAEFNPDYYNYFNNEIQCPYWSFPVIRNVGELDRNRRGSYIGFKAMAMGLFPVPKPRSEGERAMEMTMDWRDNSPTNHVVNMMNNGTIPELPSDCVIEIPGVFKNHQITPINTIHISKEVAELLRPHCEQHRLTVNAALGNNLDLVIKAMKHDPMCQWIEDDDKIEYLTKLMLYYQQEWLPTQWKEWIPKIDELKQSKYWVDPTDLVKKGNMYKEVKFPPAEQLKKKAFFWKN